MREELQSCHCAPLPLEPFCPLVPQPADPGNDLPQTDDLCGQVVPWLCYWLSMGENSSSRHTCVVDDEILKMKSSSQSSSMILAVAKASAGAACALSAKSAWIPHVSASSTDAIYSSLVDTLLYVPGTRTYI